MADIQDFGKKIGGARKDLWAGRGLVVNDIREMNDLERQNYIKKDSVWPKPNWEDVIASGVPQGVAYWQNHMRQAIPPRPPSSEASVQKNYIEVVGQIREAVMATRTAQDVDTFYQSFLRPNFVVSKPRSYYVEIEPNADGIVTNKVLKAAQSKAWRMTQDAEKKLFGIPKDQKAYVACKQYLSVFEFDNGSVTYGPDEREVSRNILKISANLGSYYYYLHESNEFYDPALWKTGTYFVMDERKRKPIAINFDSRVEAEAFVENFAKNEHLEANEATKQAGKGSGTKRKGAFTPPQLRGFYRDGPDYRRGHNADGHLFLNDLKFRGGEFGNWLNDNDRQTSMNMAYDGLRDLARILNIRPDDISFDQSLSIAFGARGRGGMSAGAAHYEPDRQVINLTKMSGAGCLAHEWGHALDHAIGRAFGIVGFASENDSSKLPAAFRDLMSSLQYKKVILQEEEVQAENAKRAKHCRQNLCNWIDYVKPSKMNAELARAWEANKNELLNSLSDFSGVEYIDMGRGRSSSSNTQVEELSLVHKQATNRSIPKTTKRQISLWAYELRKALYPTKSQAEIERVVKTDYYKGSIDFDKAFTKMGHGYWQSKCEMFARAFDCYVSDKLKEAGVRSEYLTARADSFSYTDSEGRKINAIPIGEERVAIFEKIDRLLEVLKEQSILHAYVEPKIEPRQFHRSSPTLEAEPSSLPERTEQLSFDQLLFSAKNRAEDQSLSGRSASPMLSK